MRATEAKLNPSLMPKYRIIYMMDEEAHKLFIVHVGPRGGAYATKRSVGEAVRSAPSHDDHIRS